MIGKMTISASIAVASILFYAGCGSNNNSNNENENENVPVVPAPTGTAFYLDSALEGIQMNCGGVETTTDILGSFSIVDGASCSFKLNDLLLREQAGIKDGDKILEDNLQVAQFLQSLDNDNDPSNGITITAEVLAQLKKYGVTEVPATDEAMAEIIVNLQNADIGFGGDLVSKEDAQAHLDATKKELESGSVENKPPKAVAPSDFDIEYGRVIKLDGGKSSDEDGKIVSYVWVELGNEGNPRNDVIGEFGGLHEGVHKFVLTVTDDDGATASDEVWVTVKEPQSNKPPKAVAPSDFDIELGKIVTLDGSKSSDEDGEIVSYVWVEVGNESKPINNVIGEWGDLSEGKHKFILTVTDNDDATASDEVVVTVKSAGISSQQISSAIVGKELYKPIKADNNAFVPKKIFREVYRPTMEEYAFNENGTHLTFKVIYADDNTTILKEDYTFTIEDDYVTLTVMTSSGSESLPVGTVIKLHIIELTDEYVTAKDDSQPENIFKMYYDAATAAALAK